MSKVEVRAGRFLLFRFFAFFACSARFGKSDDFLAAPPPAAATKTLV